MEGQMAFDEYLGIHDDLELKIKTAIKKIQFFEPEEGYWLGFSGGKDSIVCKRLLEMAKVKFESHYSITTVDPPELLKYIKEKHPDVIRDIPENYKNFWELMIEKKTPPTRRARYCCAELKEGGGKGRFVVTGVRWYESNRRKNTRTDVELFTMSKAKKALKMKEMIYKSNDNSYRRLALENCQSYGKYVLNPIINWTDENVWQFIKEQDLDYCELYDQGFDRLGCVGCPMARNGRIEEFKRWPAIYMKYIKTFDVMAANCTKEDKTWFNGLDVMAWYLEIDGMEMQKLHQEILQNRLE